MQAVVDKEKLSLEFFWKGKYSIPGKGVVRSIDIRVHDHIYKTQLNREVATDQLQQLSIRANKKEASISCKVGWAHSIQLILNTSQYERDRFTRITKKGKVRAKREKSFLSTQVRIKNSQDFKAGRSYQIYITNVNGKISAECGEKSESLQQIVREIKIIELELRLNMLEEKLRNLSVYCSKRD